MARFRWLDSLSRLGLEFWLPLPLIAAGIWGGSLWLNRWALSQTHATQQQQQVSIALTLNVLSIDAEIDRHSKSTEVSVQTAGSALKQLEFEYPVTEFVEVEQAIAQELNLPPDAIRSLIRYRID
jgi:hypothetical protein